MSSPKANSKTLRVFIGSHMPLRACVTQHLTAISTQPVVTYESLAKAAAEASVTRILVAITSPIESLAQRLIGSQTPTEALEVWKVEAGALLGEMRRMRRELVVVDARSLLSSDADALAELEIDTASVAEFAEIPPPPSSMMLVLADALLTNDVESSRMVAEIDAMRHGSYVALLDIEQLSAAHEEYTNLTWEIALLRENIGQQIIGAEDADLLRALLRENISQQIIGAEDADLLRAQLVKESDSLRKISADRHLMKAQSEALGRRIETDKKRAAIREAVLGAVMLEDQKEKEKAAAGHEASAHELAGEVLFLKGELDRVYNSKSWRLTKSLRTVRSSLARRQN